MASNRWASGSVAGVALTDAGGRDLRTDVVDGEPFHETLIGNATEALDLTVHTQLLARSKSGVHFGVRIAQMPASKWTAIVTAIEAAIGAGNPFPVVLSDTGVADNISVKCVPDYAALNGKLLARGRISAGYVHDVQMRFISTGPNP
jgi:hypothetical protein